MGSSREQGGCYVAVETGDVCTDNNDVVWDRRHIDDGVRYPNMEQAVAPGSYNYHYPQNAAPTPTRYNTYVPTTTGGKVYPGEYPPYPGYAADAYSPCKQQQQTGHDSCGYPTKEGAPVKEEKPKKTESLRISHQTYMALAFVVMVCFNCPVGLIAVGMAYYSQCAFRDGNKKEGERRANLALCCSMLGILITVAIVIAVVWHSVWHKEE